MAGTRQVLPTLDLRTAAQRQGVTRTQETVQAIAGILQILGAKEQKRRERQTLDRIVRAVGAGATTIEAIAAAAEQKPELGGGFRGLLRGVAGGFQPGGGGGIGQGIQQAIVGQALQTALAPKPLLSREEQKEVALFGRRERPEVPQPFTLGPGQRRVSPTGEVIAEVPPTPKAVPRKRTSVHIIEDPDRAGKFINALVDLDTGNVIKKLGKVKSVVAEKRGVFRTIEDPDNPGTFINALVNPTDGSIIKKLGKAKPEEPEEFAGLTESEKEKAIRIKAGLLPRAQADEAVEKPTKQQTQRDRDLAVIASDRKSDFQKKEARARLDADPSQPREPVPEGGSYDEFLDSGDKEGGKFGKKAYDAALQRVEDEARLQGLDPKTAKPDFDRWWDKRVAGERGGTLRRFKRNVTIPRSQFQDAEVDITELDDAELQRIAEGT